jgi:protein-S-isoprenylcysteine O-methyltransferase Ste14
MLSHAGRRLQDMQDHADVVVKPPILFAGAVLLGCLLSWIAPLGPGLGSANTRALAAGGALALIGFALGALSVREFRRAGTSLIPGEPSTVLLESGPYRYTRNPIYIGFVIFYFGLAIMLTSAWMLVLLIPVLIVLQRGVVEREEAYLQVKFGEAYRKYQARVPRWL